MENKDEMYMKEALELAKKAFHKNEVPIGCVIVHKGQIIGKGYNLRNTEKNALRHAEITAIDQACTHLGDWRLDDCTIYVTLEPCPMCAGAILQARIPRLVYGAKNPKAGAVGSVVNLLNNNNFNHTVDITEGTLREDCASLMKLFFANLRA
ncbi:MAG: tRNA adenosine(34) deaminase TadA [Defluviitaleaceae bacterium]|nr:tRNA adenosine(34) deaminase TadA [Defluviitaleaceae bacterium]